MTKEEWLTKFSVMTDEELVTAFGTIDNQLNHMLQVDVIALMEERDVLESEWFRRKEAEKIHG